MLWKHPNWMSDKWFLKSLWKRSFGYELDLEHPKTFNEKLQWLKLYDRKPEYTMMVDILCDPMDGSSPGSSIHEIF